MQPAAVDSIPPSLLDSCSQEELRLGKYDQPEPDRRGGIGRLAYMHPLCPLDLEEMSDLFGKSKATVMRAVYDGRLPKPFSVFSENLWLVGGLLEFFKRLMEEAQERGTPGRPSRKGSRRRDPGTSPIRRRRNAGSS